MCSKPWNKLFAVNEKLFQLREETISVVSVRNNYSATANGCWCVWLCTSIRLSSQQYCLGLCDGADTKKSYISRLENGKADVQLTTLFRIFEGLGRRVSLTILWGSPILFLGIMVSHGEYIDGDYVLVYRIDQTVFGVDPSWPFTSQVVFQSLRFPHACIWMFHDVF